MCKQYVFRFYNQICHFSIAPFCCKSVHVVNRQKKKKASGFQISYFDWLFCNNVTAVKGLSEGVRDMCTVSTVFTNLLKTHARQFGCFSPKASFAFLLWYMNYIKTPSGSFFNINFMCVSHLDTHTHVLHLLSG